MGRFLFIFTLHIHVSSWKWINKIIIEMEQKKGQKRCYMGLTNSSHFGSPALGNIKDFNAGTNIFSTGFGFYFFKTTISTPVTLCHFVHCGQTIAKPLSGLSTMRQLYNKDPFQQKNPKKSLMPLLWVLFFEFLSAIFTFSKATLNTKKDIVLEKGGI